MKPKQYLLVIFEELGGDVSKISLVKRARSSVCADASEHHPTIENWQIDSSGETKMIHNVKVHLRCAPGQTIASIKFASFGTPLGACGSFQKGTCHAPNSHEVLEKVHILRICVPAIVFKMTMILFSDTDFFVTTLP